MSAPLEPSGYRPDRSERRRMTAFWAVLGGVVTAAAVVAIMVALRPATDSGPLAAAHQITASTSTSPVPSHSHAATQSKHPIKAVHHDRTPKRRIVVSSLENDGASYGVGMPLVLFMTPVPRDPRAFEAAVKVRVNGHLAQGAWYWEQPTKEEKHAHIVEAHFRMPGFWPQDSQVHVSIPIAGLSAGKNLVYGNKLTSLSYAIGDAHISTVDARTLQMTVTSNGQFVKQFPVSLGAAATPTFNGTKVVMQKGEDYPGTNTLRPNGTVMMSGPGYFDDPVQWSVRVTQSGEYVHSAPWNQGIGQRSTSNGCTNLHPADAEWFYGFSGLGDVVKYTGTDGTGMPSWDGIGDWNVPWPTWQLGGMLHP